ncbi:MAG TPA: hypothetical protein VNV63_00500, partial [Nitrospiria bacterium]|nr:hypothetical protein [Nitrospiria bacterium]
MKRMLTFSLTVHLTAGILFVFLAWIGERRIESSVYTVNLITPVSETKETAPEPKKEQAPKIAKPPAAKPAPPKAAKPVSPAKETKRPPASLSRFEQQIAKLQKQVSSPEPPKSAVQ